MKPAACYALPVSATDGDDAVPQEVIEEFGSEKARPRVVKTYTLRWGLRKFRPPTLFTNGTAKRLRQQGVLEVEVRWRRLRRYISLVRGYRFVRAGAPARNPEQRPAPSGQEQAGQRDLSA